MKMRVKASVAFTCPSCGSSELRVVGAVKTDNDKSYIICQCECGETVPLCIDSIILKLYEIAPPKLTN